MPHEGSPLMADRATTRTRTRTRTRLLLCLLLLCGLLLCLSGPGVADEQPSIRSSRGGARKLPLPKGDEVFHFIVYGDRTGGPAAGIEILRKAVRETNLLDPDLVMTVGDLIQGYTGQGPWLAQMKEFRGVMEGLRMPWYPVAGNHDIYWRGARRPSGHHEANYEAHFGPLWYWFQHKNAGFVVLYSDEGDAATNRKGWRNPGVNQMSAVQLRWLASALTEAKGLDHVFVFLHHPKWRTDYYKGSNWDAAHELLRKAGNVSAVFAGHMHRRRYHGARDGIEYYTLAAVGGTMPFNLPGTGHLHHMDVVTVRKDRFQVATLPVGSVLDPKEMTPERLAEIDTLRALTISTRGAPPTLTHEGAVDGVLHVEIENPVSRPLEISLGIEGADRHWWIRPDHRHARIEPGEKAALAFPLERVAVDGLSSLKVPKLTLQVEYLATTMRVRLPLIERALPLGLGPLPASFLAERPNRVLRLDGRSTCLAVPHALIDLPDGPLTIEGLLKADSYAKRRGYLAKTEHSEYGLFVSNGTPSFSIWLGNRYVTATGPPNSLVAGRWYHLAGVFDGRAVRLYVDGVRVAAVPGAGARRRRDLPLFVGADPRRDGRPTSFIAGRIDEVRLSKVARYRGPGFVPRLRHEPDDETVLLLHLDGALGPFAPDASAGARHVLHRGRVAYDDLVPAPEAR